MNTDKIEIERSVGFRAFPQCRCVYYGDDVSDTEFTCKRDGAVVDPERVEGGIADVRGVESDGGGDAGGC